MTQETKVCSKCNESKPVTDFFRLGKGYRNPCKPCHKVTSSEWPSKNPERRRYVTLKYKTGITKEGYESRYNAQNGRCLTCNIEQKILHVDHDHACCPSGKACGRCIRALLCNRCNVVLGQVEDDPDLLIRLSMYVEAFNVLREAELGRMGSGNCERD